MKYHLIPVVVILTSSLVLIAIWFGDGLMKGVAESGLPLYSAKNSELFTRNAWIDWGFGNYTSSLPATWPTYWFLSKLEGIGMPAVFIQALLFYVFLAVSGLSIYFLARLLFRDISRPSALVSVYFYWFSPLVLINIWNRFLYDFFFLYAFLPLGLIVFLYGLKKKNYTYAVIFGLSSLLYSFASAALAAILFLWITLSLTAFFYLIVGSGKRLFIIKYFLLSFFFFVLVNTWWIVQVIYLGQSADFGRAVAMFAAPNGNLDSLKSVSSSLGSLTYLYRFLHGDYFSGIGSWSVGFTHPLSVVVELLITLTIIAGTIFYRKKRSVLFLGILFFAGMYLMKGVSQPFGEIFEFLFNRITPLQLFRNPFEKFSLMVVISSSLLFAFTIFKIVNYFKNFHIRSLFYLGVFAVLIVFWGYPLLSNRVFSYSEVWDRSAETSYSVKVPDYYKDISQWLKSQPGNFRFISLPLGDEGIRYAWEHPYRGVEPSYILLSSPGLTNSTTIPFYNFITQELERNFFNSSNFTKVMNAVNAKYILLRKDVNWKVERMRDPLVIQQMLQESKDFTKAAEFGQLSVWENKNWKEQFIFSTDKYVYSSPVSNLFDIGIVDKTDVVVVEPKASEADDMIIHPSFRYFFSGPVDPTFDKDPTIFPHVSNFPTSFKYPFTILKEKLTLSSEKSLLEKIETRVVLLGKRLVEAKISKDNDNPRSAEIAVRRYIGELQTFEGEFKLLNSNNVLQTVWQQEKLANVFSKHEKVLMEMEQFLPLSADARRKLHEMQKRINVLPEYGIIADMRYPVDRRNIYRFEVPQDGEYSLILNTKDWNDFYSEALESIQIDNTLYPLDVSLNQDGYTNLGLVELTGGIHEAGFNTPDQKNLVTSEDELTLTVDHGEKEARFGIEDYNSFFNYEISFDYFIKMGSGFEISLDADNDVVNKGRKVKFYTESFVPDSYFFGQQRFQSQISPSPNSTDVELIFKVTPWNNCESIFWTSGKEVCDNPEIRSRYDKTTEVVISNIQVKRALDIVPILKLASELETDRDLPALSYERVSPVLYKVNVREASSNFMLVLSQLYNSGWKVTFADGSDLTDEHFLVNGFANGWMIKKRGDFDIYIEYFPQRYLDFGKKVSTIGFILGLVIILIRVVKRKNEK